MDLLFGVVALEHEELVLGGFLLVLVQVGVVALVQGGEAGGAEAEELGGAGAAFADAPIEL